MASSGSVFSETLQEITNTKLSELSKRRAAFEEAKSSLLVAVKLEQNDPVQRLTILSDGVKSCFDVKLHKDGRTRLDHSTPSSLQVDLSNLDSFLAQAKCDPSVSAKMLDTWEQTLLRHLDTQSLKFSYASLYGQLVTEWLSGNNDDGQGASDDVEMGEAFEVVSDSKKLESRIEWEKMVFEPAKVDERRLMKYLNGLFGAKVEAKKGIWTALEKLRESVAEFERSLAEPHQFKVETLKWAIQGLYVSDLLSDEKREVLKDFEGNNTILREIADVLNMRLSALGSWTWSSDSTVSVELQRKISGIYNVRMHEDLLQAIFLQYIGVKWSVFFKKTFNAFRKNEGAWKSSREDIPRKDIRRLEYYLGPLQDDPCLHTLQEVIYRKSYFAAQLLDHERQTISNIDGEEEVEYTSVAPESLKRSAQAPVRQLASKAARKSAPSQGHSISMGGAVRHRKIFTEPQEPFEDDGYEVDPDQNRNPLALKQQLLHLLSTEITINTHLHGEMTAFHAVFQSWNPLLPHATIQTILKFLGVSDKWLDFFTKFLEAPLKFVDDDKSIPTRRRRRGTPASHVLSDVFGETTLFCLDFAINQWTSGDHLWRVQDDVWFWSRDHSLAVKAWEAIDEFATITGTEIDPNKSGTVRVSKDPKKALPIDESLPEGEIRWGFLKLSPQLGRFEIDQDMVDTQIAELRRQLNDKHSKSVLGFIQAWNTFAATFFATNFGKAANCFGRDHVDNMLATHRRIEQGVFSTSDDDDDNNGKDDGKKRVLSVANHLKTEISRRFGVDNISDGYLYFPIELGGLDLKSPFISLLQMRDAVLDSSKDLLDGLVESEREAYKSAEKAFYDGTVNQERYALDDPDWVPESAHDRENFCSFDEFVRYRDFYDIGDGTERTPRDVYLRLLERPGTNSLRLGVGPLSTALQEGLSNQSNLRGITKNWNTMDSYWRWVTVVYGPDIVDRFGGLNIVDPGLLPMGMVSIFRDKRVKW